MRDDGYSLLAGIKDAFDERRAIMELDGGLDPLQARASALADVRERYANAIDSLRSLHEQMDAEEYLRSADLPPREVYGDELPIEPDLLAEILNIE